MSGTTGFQHNEGIHAAASDAALVAMTEQSLNAAAAAQIRELEQELSTSHSRLSNANAELEAV